MSKNEFMMCMEILKHTCSNSPKYTRKFLQIWYKLFGSYGIEEFEQMVLEYIQTEKFYPAPADLFKLSKRKDHPDPAELNRLFRKYYDKPEKLDELVKKAFDICGGIRNMAMMNTEDAEKRINYEVKKVYEELLIKEHQQTIDSRIKLIQKTEVLNVEEK